VSGSRSRRRRNRFEIWASILTLLVEDEATLNRIVFLANLNRATARQRLDELISSDLIHMKRNGFKKYSVTIEGVRWLKRNNCIARTGASDDKKDTK
jgi:predicted transcriptional regulator